MRHREILEFLQVFRAAGLDFLEIETGEFRLTVRRDCAAGNAGSRAAGETLAGDGVAAARDRAPLEVAGLREAGRAQPETHEPAVSAELEGSAAREVPDVPDGSVVISAPTAGVFYRRPQPGAPAFVEQGAPVTQGATVGLIEVMKLFNAVTSPADGVVDEVRAADEEVVEAGQPLVIIRPAG